MCGVTLTIPNTCDVEFGSGSMLVWFIYINRSKRSWECDERRGLNWQLLCLILFSMCRSTCLCLWRPSKLQAFVHVETCLLC